MSVCSVVVVIVGPQTMSVLERSVHVNEGTHAFERGRAPRPISIRWPRAASFGPRWCAVFGVAGVVGWDHGSWSGACDERPAVMGFEVVVELAERVGFVEAGVMGVAPFVLVVVLEPFGAGAAEPGAVW